MKDWILEKLGGMFGPKYIGALIRSLLLLLSGWLLKLGIPQADIDRLLLTLDPVLTGVVTALITLGWSFLQKSRHSD